MGRSQKIRYNQFLKDKELLSPNEIKHKQEKLLRNMCLYAIKSIPWYTEHCRLSDNDLEVIPVKELLNHFPVLEKEDLQKNFDSLFNPTIKKFIKNTSGGSTGNPSIFLQDESFLAKTPTLYANGLAGYMPGDKVTQLWGSEKEFLSSGYNLKSKLTNSLVYRLQFLNSFRLSDEIMFRYVNEINRFQPKIIIAYVHSIYEFSKFILRNNLHIHSPKSIIVTAGTLFLDQRKIIEEAFKSEVFNRYGSREVGNIAMECESHDAMHQMPFNNFIEVVDETNSEVADGEEGYGLSPLLQTIKCHSSGTASTIE